jgi:hypothetical protein
VTNTSILSFPDIPAPSLVGVPGFSRAFARWPAGTVFSSDYGDFSRCFSVFLLLRSHIGWNPVGVPGFSRAFARWFPAGSERRSGLRNDPVSEKEIECVLEYTESIFIHLRAGR